MASDILLTSIAPLRARLPSGGPRTSVRVGSISHDMMCTEMSSMLPTWSSNNQEYLGEEHRLLSRRVHRREDDQLHQDTPPRSLDVPVSLDDISLRSWGRSERR